MRCAVVGCGVYIDLTKIPKGQKSSYTFHNIPVDPKIREIWLQRCGLKENDIKRPSVCKRHFLPTDFSNKSRKRIKLKSGTIPSVALPRVVLPSVVLPSPAVVSTSNEKTTNHQQQ